jgi:enoyl-CoA hydratase/carnithine racemase
MVSSTLELKKEQHIAIIDLCGTLGEKDRLFQLADELADVCREINLDSGIYVVVLKGIDDRGMESNAWIQAIDETGNSYFRWPADSISRLDRPIVAELSRNMIGLGLEMALACDIRVAGESSCFGFPHVQQGLIPCDGGTQRLSRVVGKAKAMELILTGVTIDAQEAVRIGLVNRLAIESELCRTVADIAHDMAGKGPIALRYAKEAINRGMDLTLEQGLRLETDLYLLLHTTADRTEGIKGFQEKKQPTFVGS